MRWKGGRENGAGWARGKETKSPFFRFQGPAKFCPRLLFRGSIPLDLLGVPLQQTGHVPGQVLTANSRAEDLKVVRNLSTFCFNTLFSKIQHEREQMMWECLDLRSPFKSITFAAVSHHQSSQVSVGSATRKYRIVAAVLAVSGHFLLETLSSDLVLRGHQGAFDPPAATSTLSRRICPACDRGHWRQVYS